MNPETQFDAVIFDCDGVLVDTEHMINKLWQTMLSEIGLVLTDEEMMSYFSGKSLPDNITKAVELLGHPLPDHFRNDMAVRGQQLMATELERVPFIEETLLRINLPKAVGTNSFSESLDFKLHKADLTKHFQAYICIDHVEAPKPAPDIYLLAAETLGVNPEKCAVIEDSPIGIRAGVAAGMTVFAYAATMNEEEQKQAGASVCFTDMRELPGLLSV
ncbi:HAD family hydrolase [Sessilibacter corallicola]|uniref:HAD family hydrolase n=1 Tax=Sessilibacter corallicola TaxID=2904075 RepID=UPI001E378559|nr:HAD family phosphatase [Sessilibacter corallicola]MCE2030543.1 HAD family phosphatase [Sessilibacter corallicola]